jgi:two-component system response regulator
VHQKFILLVEDDEDHVTLATRSLRENRVVNEIVVMRDGAAARDFLFARGAHAGRDTRNCPQLILLDLKLPKLDGLELLGRIRAYDHTRLCPVVILTSSDHEDDVARSYGLGANSYVRKPIDFDRFVAAMREVSVYWLVLNEPPPPPPAGAQLGERSESPGVAPRP